LTGDRRSPDRLFSISAVATMAAQRTGARGNVFVCLMFAASTAMGPEIGVTPRWTYLMSRHTRGLRLNIYYLQSFRQVDNIGIDLHL